MFHSPTIPWPAPTDARLYVYDWESSTDANSIPTIVSFSDHETTGLDTSTTTTIGFFSRDPIGYVDGYNTYECYFVPNDLDQTGLQVAVPRPLPAGPFIPRPRIYVPQPEPFIPTPPMPPVIPTPTGGPRPNPDPSPSPEPLPDHNPPGEGIDPPGDCGQYQYDQLRSAVQRDCKDGAMPSCKKGVWLFCDSFKDQAEKFDKCADSRRRLQQACFKGGDWAHKARNFKIEMQLDGVGTTTGAAQNHAPTLV